MDYIGTTINESSVITAKAGATIANGAGCAVCFDEDGAVVLTSAGSSVIGILAMDTPEAVEAGDEVTVQIRNTGLAKAGEPIKAGDIVVPHNAGALVPSKKGGSMFGFALSEAKKAGDFFSIDICKGNYVNPTT